MGEGEPVWRTPSNREWAESKAWAREFKARLHAARLDQCEWTEGIRRRLGLVAEMHRCRAWRCGDGDWGWFCLRRGCGETGHFLPSQAKAVASAQEHTRAFVPQLPAVVAVVAEGMKFR